jgi:hypothetical protein
VTVRTSRPCACCRSAGEPAPSSRPRTAPGHDAPALRKRLADCLYAHENISCTLQPVSQGKDFARMSTVKVFQHEYTDPKQDYKKLSTRMGTKEYIERIKGWIVGSGVEVDPSNVDAEGKTQAGFNPPRPTSTTVSPSREKDATPSVFGCRTTTKSRSAFLLYRTFVLSTSRRFAIGTLPLNCFRSIAAISNK